MVITINRIQGDLRQPIARVYIILATMIAFPTCGYASEWTFIPSIYLRGTYSDNIQLAQTSEARSDFVKEIKPAILISGNDARFKVNLSYRLQKLIYLHQSDSLHHELAAAANAELLDNWLFLDADSSNARQNISPFGPQTFDSIQQSTNQSDVRTNHISPYLHHTSPSRITSELRYAHDTVHSSDNLLDTTTDKIFLNFIGDNLSHNFSWDAYYYIKQINDINLTTSRGYSEAFTLRYHMSDRLGLFVTSGYERENYVTNSGIEPQGRFWNAGVNWNSDRSSLSLSAGKRFFGNTYSLSANRRNRKSLWSLSYGEDVTSTASEFIRLSQGDAANLLSELWSTEIPNPAIRKQVINAFLNTAQLLGPDRGAINYFSNNYFLQKQLSLTFAAMTAKSTLLMSISATRRSAQTNNVIDSKILPVIQQASESDTMQVGGSAGWNWHMSTRTSVNVSAVYDQTIGKGVRRDDNFALAVGLSRILRRNVIGSFDLRHMQHGSTQSGASYRENGISASLNFQL